MTRAAASRAVGVPARFLLAAVVAVGLMVGVAATASAIQASAAENAVGASTLAQAPVVGSLGDVSPATSRETYDSQAKTVSATGVAADSGTAFTRFTVDSAGETTLNLRLGSGSVQVTEHAALRMAERQISISSAEAALAQSPFQYFHAGIWKTGYYDSTSRVFVGTVNGEVTTVISNASSNYISNLQAVIP